MADFTPAPSCIDEQQANILTVNQAKEAISDLVIPITGWQKVALRDALDRTLHQPIVSPIDVPAYNNSAMDGYAVKSTDLSSDPITLTLIGTALAGHPFSGQVQSGQCIRIMTGAMMPADCDTVIMQEQTESNSDQIVLHGQHTIGQNVRAAGEDLHIGQHVFEQGQKVTPADLGLLASLGIGEVIVKRKLRVAFFSTGDELRSIGDTLEAGQIFDSNRYTLFAMLSKLNVDIIDMGVVVDDKVALRDALELASQQADVVITSGGVSVGDADYVKELLEELGQVNFWKIAMKPGRPLAFGKINHALFFGLPGNPVSVMVTFYHFVSHALQLMAGQTSSVFSPVIPVNCTSIIRKRRGRFEYQRGVLSHDKNGQLTVCTTGEQGSGILRSMSIANCFILLEEDCAGVEANTIVNVQPFSGLI
jgi:molybdopterin molybdotransferase